ncbi:hypothetical protein A4G99_13305 [Haladaptatus sp. R4]|uniref:DUF5658 family protein n=1 Tax=Haladaptatus sp. R4 TaxID=1679489 RepID=UPI0007B4A5B6|nr:DUF5658 family protein [Haladaptatus sp. R4]KZN23820.1 hypothetical protein A4G99_13305 [Haladaptatus sp. R4]
MSHQQFSYRYQRTGWFDFGDVERLLWAVVLHALVGDLVTTYVGLQVGLAESNPVARGALGRFGFLSLVGLKTFALAVGFVCRTLVPRQYVTLVPAGLAFPWVFAVVVNLSLFTRL